MRWMVAAVAVGMLWAGCSDDLPPEVAITPKADASLLPVDAGPTCPPASYYSLRWGCVAGDCQADAPFRYLDVLEADTLALWPNECPECSARIEGDRLRADGWSATVEAIGGLGSCSLALRVSYDGVPGLEARTWEATGSGSATAP